MVEWKCPFCGSKELKLETGNLTRFGDKQYTFCCGAQAANDKYRMKSFGPDNRPDLEDVSEW